MLHRICQRSIAAARVAALPHARAAAAIIGHPLIGTKLSAAMSTKPTSFSPDQVEMIRKVQERLAVKMTKDKEELKKQSGGQHPVQVWMFDYYKTKQHKFLPAAVLMMLEDPKTHLPTVSAKSLVFASHVLTSLSPDDYAIHDGTLPLVVPNLTFLLSLLHLVDTPAGKAAFQRMAAAIKRGGDDATKDAAAHIAAVPVTPVHEWPIPFVDPTFDETFKTKVFPFEVDASFLAAKEQLDFQQYLMLSTTAVLECLWAAFYATGQDIYVRRVLHIAQHWADFTSLPDHTEYCVSLEKKLPADLMKNSTDKSEAIRSVKAQMSRVAVWSLLAHSRRHPRVVEILASEVSNIAEFFSEPSARSPDLESRVPLAEAKQRMEVYPTILALIARMSLDAPFETSNPT